MADTRSEGCQEARVPVDFPKHPMRPRSRNLLIAIPILLCVLAALLYLQAKAPPAIARLLPEADAIVFVNVKPVRAATHFDRTAITRSPSFQQFIDGTGIVPERDLDSVVFALHRMPDPHGPNGAVAFSEVFRGRFDAARLTRYLTANAAAQESYAGHNLFLLPSEGRTVRVTLLDAETVAASNTPTPEQIHSILDHQRTTFNLFAGPSLLHAHYGDVPLFASAWAIGQLVAPFAENGRISIAGFALPIPADSLFVASLRYTGALHLRIDQITASDAEAAHTAQSLTTLLNLSRALQPAPRTPEETAVRQLTDSVLIEQHGSNATLTAILPADSLRRLSAMEK